MTTTNPRPFIRWAGGKQNIIKEIVCHAKKVPLANYHEPFLGAGSLFFAVTAKKYFLSDINSNLINCYTQIKNYHKEVYEGLASFKLPIGPELYYKVREEFNCNLSIDDVSQAVRFIFLNRTSFNGIYRVNLKGQYNVPFGKPTPAFPSRELLCAVSRKLEGAEIRTLPYKETAQFISPGDLVYLDPPYPGISKTAYFGHYSVERFSDNDQKDLANFASELRETGAHVLISNADTKLIRKLYRRWNIAECKSTRYVSCKKEKQQVKELIIKSY
jgi:DNA adenine methylase